jgi:hypothetical protein
MVSCIRVARRKEVGSALSKINQATYLAPYRSRERGEGGTREKQGSCDET